MAHRENQLSRLALAGRLVFFVWLAQSAGAQQPIVVTDFSVVPGWYEPPHEKQMRSLLHGARGQPLPGKRYLITDAELRTFLENGQPQLTVNAPQCLFDSDQHSINSPGRLRVQTADGKFSIEGEGFLWQQTNSCLFISNRVHTFAHPDLLEAGSQTSTAKSAGPGEGGVEIVADRFDYTANSGLGTYSGKVRVTGTNLNLTAGRLTVKVPMSEGNAGSPGNVPAGNLRTVKLQNLTFEQHVIADYENAEHEKIHATGERATYFADTGLLRVSGQPAWRAAEREGSGDELVMDRTNKTMRANGHAWLKMPLPGHSGAGFLPAIDSLGTNAPPTANSVIEVRSGSYELRTNLALFRDDVRLTRHIGDEPKGKMSCGVMTLVFSGTNQMQSMVAERSVVIEQEDKRFAAEKALYTATNGLLELTGKPSWQAGPRQGKGDRMLVNTERGDMLVRGNSVMRFPAAEFVPPAASGPAVPAPALSSGATNQFAEIFAEEYSLRRETNLLTAQFRGGVYVTHPQMNLACESLAVHLPAAGSQVDRIVARQGVIFDLVSDKGEKLHGNGEQAVYTYGVTATATNKLVELTGNPSLETTNGVFRNSVILLDLGNSRVIAPGQGGKYVIRASVPGIDTNQFLWRNPMPTK